MSKDVNNYFNFKMTGSFNASGNVCSMVHYEGLSDYCFYNMFHECNVLKKAPDLPSMDLAKYCYYSMFCGCASLTSAPELPAAMLTDHCYFNMFSGCTKLTGFHEFPDNTQLNDYCYAQMFDGCTALLATPNLPAETLASHCYDSMFQGCSQLKKATLLPASQFSNKWRSCYVKMFKGSGLTISTSGTDENKILDFPASLEVPAEYYAIYMFQGCVGG